MCSSSNYTLMHTQDFVVPDSDAPISYSIVCCKNCGFLYVCNGMSDEDSKSYYSKMSKYSYNQGKVPLGLQKIHNDIYSFFDQHFKKVGKNKKREFKILDVGCSTGHLLHLFKENGYVDVIGVDPSPGCNDIARKLYNIQILPSSLCEFRSNKRFDIVVLSGILEHICDLQEFLFQTTKVLHKDSWLLVIVPDVEHFSKNPVEAFHEFSLEHINFFSSLSLKNLFGRFGLECINTKTIDAEVYDSKALIGIFKNTGKHISITQDSIGKVQLKMYVKNSRKKMKELNRKFDKLIKTGEQHVVWGTGSYAARLVASSHLGSLPIIAFVNRDKNTHESTFNGIEIKPSEWLRGKIYPIIIASKVYELEIKAILQEKLNYRGNIISL